MSNGGSIRTYGRHINLAAELCGLFGSHASSDVAPRNPEACLPTVSIQYLRYIAHTRIDHEILDPSHVPEQPYDGIMVIETLPQLGVGEPCHNAVLHTGDSRYRGGVDVSVLSQEYLRYRGRHVSLLYVLPHSASRDLTRGNLEPVRWRVNGCVAALATLRIAAQVTIRGASRRRGLR